MYVRPGRDWGEVREEYGAIRDHNNPLGRMPAPRAVAVGMGPQGGWYPRLDAAGWVVGSRLPDPEEAPLPILSIQSEGIWGATV